MNKLAIITVVYNNYEVLKDFLESFRKQTNQDFCLYIIDLSDKTFFSHSGLDPESIKNDIDSRLRGNDKGKGGNDTKYKLLSADNKGYAYGVNLGVKQAISDGYESFVVINDDTFVKSDFVDQCLKCLNKNPNSIISGKIYYAPGFEYHKDRYSKKDLGKVIWYAGGSIDWNNVYINHRGVDEIDKKQFDLSQETDFITGCLMLFDKSAIDKIGYWDESYFLYYEDADWGEQAKKIAIKLIYDPSIIIWHKNAGSTGGSGSTIHQKYQNKNRIKFGLKYAPLRTKIHLLWHKLSLRA